VFLIFGNVHGVADVEFSAIRIVKCLRADIFFLNKELSRSAGPKSAPRIVPAEKNLFPSIRVPQAVSKRVAIFKLRSVTFLRIAA
jgi:hypothetical protein